MSADMAWLISVATFAVVFSLAIYIGFRLARGYEEHQR